MLKTISNVGFSELGFVSLAMSYLFYLGNKHCLNILVVIGFLHVITRHYFKYIEQFLHEK